MVNKLENKLHSQNTPHAERFDQTGKMMPLPGGTDEDRHGYVPMMEEMASAVSLSTRFPL
jgi:hypothetical protein